MVYLLTGGWGFPKRILCSLLVTNLPFGNVRADAPDSKNAKIKSCLLTGAAGRFRQEQQGRRVLALTFLRRKPGLIDGYG